MVTCMLMRFSVSNFMSFGYSENPDGTVKTAEFHLYAGRTEQFKERVMHINGRNLLKFASLYGANAAGKTNLTRAIGFGRQIILSTIEKRDAQDKYCRSKKENRDKPTQFEYEFSVGDKCFAYGFTVNLYNKSILSEWLYELNGSKESTIFERLAEKELYYFDESIFSESENIQQFHFFMKDANRINNSLLLYELNRRKLEHQDFQVFATVFEWFQKDLIVIYPDTKIGKSYFRFESDKDKLTKILDYLDTGITDYDMHKINEEAFREYFSDASLADMFLTRQDKKDKDALKSILYYGNTLFELDYGDEKADGIYKLMFRHGTDESSYEYGEESDGTRRLIELLDIILNENKKKVFIVDELDRSLHPQMTKKFVETFLKFSKNMNTQLIITTHESNLMDLTLLRRDEIWFAERDWDSTTSLYSLEKFKARYDTIAAKNYLSGRYGAVPVFKDFEYVFGED